MIPGSIVSLCNPRTWTADPLDGKHTVDPLGQWDHVVERNCRASTGLPPSNFTEALTGHCVVRRRWTCKEWNGTGEGNVWSQLAFHIVGTKPSEASHCGAEPRARPVINYIGVTNVANDGREPIKLVTGPCNSDSGYWWILGQISV